MDVSVHMNTAGDFNNPLDWPFIKQMSFVVDLCDQRIMSFFGKPEMATGARP
jgi:hypothetical protein